MVDVPVRDEDGDGLEPVLADHLWLAGLGILAAATMTFEELEHAIQKVKDSTDRNFGVNLRAEINKARLQIYFRLGVSLPPIEVRRGERGISPERLAQLRHDMGLDQPLWKQFLDYVNALLHGDFGTSFFSKEDVLDLILLHRKDNAFILNTWTL